MARQHRIRGKGGRFVPRAEKVGFVSDSLTPGITAYGPAVIANVHRIAREWGKDAVAYMQHNARWDDRTGDARRGLDFAVDEGAAEVTVMLYHTVSYGKWLEIRWNGEYAIILPTIETLGPDLMRRLEGAF